MDILHPMYLFLLFPLFLFALFLLWNQRFFKSQIKEWIEIQLLKRLFPYSSWRKWNFFKITLQIATGLLLVLALAGPQAGQKLREFKIQGTNIFILFDCSSSMLAKDFSPNRLEKSKRLLTGLLENLSGNRIGIIPFAGQSYVYCPITFDLSTVKQFLKNIHIDMIPTPGTRIGTAIRLATQKMEGLKGSNSIILLTDGEDHKSDPLQAAEKAKEKGIHIFTIGIGNPDGEPIPNLNPDGTIESYKKDKQGNVILSRLDENTLAQIALTTGGTYFRATATEKEIDAIKEQIQKLEKDPVTKNQITLENRYQWFLALAFICWLLSESLFWITARLWKLGLTLLFLFTFPQNGFTEDAESLLRKGNNFFKQKKYPQALEMYEKAELLNPQDMRLSYNQGVASHQIGDLEKATRLFQKNTNLPHPQLQALAHYNLGVTQLQEQKFDESIASFKESLKLNPTDTNTLHNLELAIHYKQNPPKQQPQQGQGQGQGKPQQSNAQENEEKQKQREENAKRLLDNAANEGEADPSKRKLPQNDEDKNSKDSYTEDW